MTVPFYADRKKMKGIPENMCYQNHYLLFNGLLMSFQFGLF